VFKAMACHDMDCDVWMEYFFAFITYRLKLTDQGNDNQSNIAKTLLRKYFAKLHDKKKISCRVVELHCHTSIFSHLLAQVATIYRCLSKMEELQFQPQEEPQYSLSVTQHGKHYLDAIEFCNDPIGSPSYLSNFIVKTLFNTLAATLNINTNAGMLVQDWFKSYR
jgi:hypothetical protein